MSWSGAMDRIQTLLEGVGAGLSRPVDAEHVIRGQPYSLVDRQIGYWYNGDQESSTGGNTFGKQNVQERITIGYFEPVISRDENTMSAVELRLQEANRAIQAALLGDLQEPKLGQTDVIGLAIQNTTAGWLQVGEAWKRVLEIPVWIDLAWTADIG